MGVSQPTMLKEDGMNLFLPKDDALGGSIDSPARMCDCRADIGWPDGGGGAPTVRGSREPRGVGPMDAKQSDRGTNKHGLLRLCVRRSILLAVNNDGCSGALRCGGRRLAAQPPMAPRLP